MLEPDESQALRELLVKDTPEAVSKRFRLGVVTLLRAAVGLRTHQATSLVIRANLLGRK